MNLADLHKPFPPDKISWRVGPTNKAKTSGLALAYLDSRDVQERLDAVCGYGGWQSRFPHANGKTICEIGIKVGDEWVWKADGAGDTDMEAEKGAISSAFKRAAVHWGIGRYLYDLDSPWVAIEEAGKSYKIAESEYAKLRALLSRNAGSSIGQATAQMASAGTGPLPQPTGSPQSIKKTPRQAIAEIEAINSEVALDDWSELHKDWLVRLAGPMPAAHKQVLDAVKARSVALAK